MSAAETSSRAPLPVPWGKDLIALAPEGAGEGLGDSGVVFDEQNSCHIRDVRRRRNNPPSSRGRRRYQDETRIEWVERPTLVGQSGFLMRYSGKPRCRCDISAAGEPKNNEMVTETSGSTDRPQGRVGEVLSRDQGTICPSPLATTSWHCPTRYLPA